MGGGGSSGKARRATQCGASGKQRNAADEPPLPVPCRPDRVAALIRCPTSRGAPRLFTTAMNPDQMAPYDRNRLQPRRAANKATHEKPRLRQRRRGIDECRIFSVPEAKPRSAKTT